MRTLPVIDTKWKSGGPFIGDRKPTTRATVQMPWPDLVGTEHPEYFLRRTWNSGIGSSTNRGTPMRWYQRKNNTQVEKEIPNISTVSIDRSIDQDAASFEIRIKNQWMYVNGGAPNQAVLGQPGFFSPTRGNSSEENARWGHTVNEWNDVLVPNAVIRIYTGYGGEGSTVQNEVAQGNLCLYGVFLVDEVSVTTSGALSIRGRDMMKLLIDQQLFPPLVPDDKYPLGYYRWSYEDVPIRNAGRHLPVGASTAVPPLGEKRTVYRDSAVDRWYGSNASIYSHRGTHSVDGDPHSYALSVGNSGPNRPFTTDWWEYDCGEEMNAVWLHPWAGGYTMYVSVMVSGVWQGAEVIPYDPSHLFATQSPAVDTGANIPYVASFEIPHEKSGEYILPQPYNAERVRVSFRNHVYSGLGVWKYRCGIREIRIRGARPNVTGLGKTVTSGDKQLVDTYVQAGGFRYVPDKPYSEGYFTVGRFNDHDAFGDARRLPRVNDPFVFPTGVESTPTAVRYNNEGTGYYVLTAGGTITAYGDAIYYGDPYTDKGFVAGNDIDEGFAWDMAVTHTGEGYWVLSSNGDIYAHGDAYDYNHSILVHSGEGYPPFKTVAIEACPYETGYWVLRSDGAVYTRGAAVSQGGIPKTGPNAMRFRHNTGDDLGIFVNASEQAQCLRATKTGEGYWCLTSKGRVIAFGDAKDFGQPHTLEDHSENLFTQAYWEIFPSPNDDGYLLLHASGKVAVFGNMENFRGPVPGKFARKRSDGNYLDYTDIVRDLILWSGFLLFDGTLPLNQPAPAYAGLESTGAFAKERLPDEIFDKRPVIDAITTLKEIVGYIAYVDSQGRFIFRSPNWWHVGNFFEEGQHVGYLLDLDERLQITDYSVSTADEPMRSSIIISSHDPYADYSETITSNYQPPSAHKLRGLVKPAMWVNSHFVSQSEQQIMAELIGLHIAFQERVGQLDCYPHPGLEIDDQIRVYERQTGETYVHYVRGISFSHDLDSGEYKTTLTTHWLAAGSDTGNVVGGESLPVSSLLAKRIEEQQFGKFSRPSLPEVT